MGRMKETVTDDSFCDFCGKLLIGDEGIFDKGLIMCCGCADNYEAWYEKERKEIEVPNGT